MKKSDALIKKAAASLLAVTLLAAAALPALAESQNSTANSKWVSNIAINDSDTANTGTVDVYDLLKDPDAGLTMSKGDTYVFDMKIKQTVSNPNNGMLYANMFAFDLLKQSNIKTEKRAGIEFLNNNVLYWSATTPYQNHLNNEHTQQVMWTGTYCYVFTVKAYDSIRAQIYNSNGTEMYYDGEVSWSAVYGLSNCTEESGTVFKPCMVFKDQIGTVSDISVTRVSKMSSSADWKTDITLNDSDTENTGTVDVYDLLADPDSGLTMSKGDTYVFSSTIRQTVTLNAATGQLMHKMFAFDLLKNSNVKTNPSGIVFINSKVEYWRSDKPSERGSVISDNNELTLWKDTDYNYVFTVKAYESIRVQVSDSKKVLYDGEISWDSVYGLSNCTEESGTVFKPCMIFTDQIGTVSDISVTRLVSKPTAEDWKTGITLKDSNPADGENKNVGTRDHYSLLNGDNDGITLSKGDKYTFEMDIYVGPNNADPGTGQLHARHFGFNLLDGANTENADITFLNNYCGYRQKKTGYVIRTSKDFTLWQGAKYHITYTVNAYDSIQVKLEDYDKNGAKTVRVEESAPWSDIWSLASCTEESNTVFKPNLMFKDTDGTVSDISVTYENTSETVLAGDANGNGKVDILDLIKIKKYTADNSVEINLKNADMNGDGTVNGSDLVMLRKLLLDIDVQ